MANRLKMAKHDAILQLYALHWSERRIARELGIDRATVARHLRRQAGLSNAAIPPAGSEVPNAASLLTPPGPGPGAGAKECGTGPATGGVPDPKAAIPPSGSGLRMRSTTGATGPAWPAGLARPAGPAPQACPETHPTSRTGRRSLCEPFRQTIVEKLKQELTAQRIYQDLLAETGYRGGYDSVKRFVRRLSGQLPSIPFRRMECAAGFEAQVDYGTGAPVIGPDGKRRKTHVFRIVLSHSRKGYSEVSFRHVGQVFEEIERSALLPLPPERFPFFHEGQRIVNRDGHVEVARAYYSVPPEYLGRTVWVRWDARLVRVFNDRREQIAVHARHEQGRFSTQAEHIVREKISGLERGVKWLMHKVRLIGPQSSAWSEAMLTARGIEGTRVLLGLIALTKKHSSSALEQACKTALSHREFRLRALRALTIRQPPVAQGALPFLDEHPLIRPLDDYAQIVALALARKGPLESPETRAAAACDSSLRFSRNRRADECQQKDPDGNDRRGLRDIHPPGSGYSSTGCAPAEPDSASPDPSTLRPMSPPLPGLF